MTNDDVQNNTASTDDLDSCTPNEYFQNVMDSQIYCRGIGAVSPDYATNNSRSRNDHSCITRLRIKAQSPSQRSFVKATAHSTP